MTIRPEIYKGAAFLDEKVPGWEHSIEIYNLNMNDSCSCVIGQVMGGFWAWFDENDLSYEDAANLGFLVSDLDGNTTYVELTNEWIEFIKDRLSM